MCGELILHYGNGKVHENCRRIRDTFSEGCAKALLHESTRKRLEDEANAECEPPLKAYKSECCPPPLPPPSSQPPSPTMPPLAPPSPETVVMDPSEPDLHLDLTRGGGASLARSPLVWKTSTQSRLGLGGQGLGRARLFILRRGIPGN